MLVRSIIFLLVSFSLVYAGDVVSENENPVIDTSAWVTFPFTLEYMEGESLQEEKATLLFPLEPKFEDDKEIKPSRYSVTDHEGMSFTVSFMRIPGGDFTLREFVDFLTENLLQSPSQKLIGVSHDPGANDSGYLIMWVQNDKMIRLTLVKSAHFIYLLETVVRDERYRNIESQEMDFEGFDEVLRDALKTEAFTRSLRVE